MFILSPPFGELYSCLSFHLHGLHGQRSYRVAFELRLLLGAGWLAAWTQMTSTISISRGNWDDTKIQGI